MRKNTCIHLALANNMALSRSALFVFFVVLAKTSSFSDNFVREQAIKVCVAKNYMLGKIFNKFDVNKFHSKLFGWHKRVLSAKRNLKHRKKVSIGKLQFNSVCCILLLCGDIETNPGPVNTCPICRTAVQVHHFAVSCDRCNYWYHIQCVSISDRMYTDHSDIPEFHWHCTSCSKIMHAIQQRKRLNAQCNHCENHLSKRCNILVEHSYAQCDMDFHAGMVSMHICIWYFRILIST